MPRSFVKGSQVGDRSIVECDLANDAVTTRTIQDGNVIEPKLADDVRARLLLNPAPMARTRLTEDLPENTDFTLPGNLDYINETVFLTRFKIWRNGALQYVGLTDDGRAVDVIPGSDTTKVKFTCPLRRGANIIVEIL